MLVFCYADKTQDDAGVPALHGKVRALGPETHPSPVMYFYFDWSVAVPMQMIVFSLTLKDAGAATEPDGF